MGMKELTKELKEEIKKTEEKLIQLRAMDNIVTSMEISDNMKNLVLKDHLPVAVSTVKTPKYKRRIKYTQFTDMETRQIINMWNSMKDIPNMNQQTIIAKIANTLKYPYKKVYNKVFWLRRTGKIVLPQGMSTTTATRENRTAKNKPFFYWTEEQKQQLKQLLSRGISRKDISTMMGIDAKVISNKIGRMMEIGEIPKNRQNDQKVTKNPLLNLK